MRRGNEFSDGRVYLLRLHLARKHLRNQTVDGGKVIATNDCKFDAVMFDRRMQRSREVNCHPATAETHYTNGGFHICFSADSPPNFSVPLAVLLVGFGSTAMRRGNTKSPVRPFSPCSLNKWRNAFGPATFAKPCTAGLKQRAVSISHVAGRTAGTSQRQNDLGKPKASARSSPINAREIP